jgi:LEA14-like dessication related protein
MASMNLFLAVLAVSLVVGGLLGGIWAYTLATPCVVPLSGAVITAIATSGGSGVSTTGVTSVATTSAASTAGVVTSSEPTGEIPQVTVDLTGMFSGPAIGGKGTLVIFLTLTNPSDSSVTVTSISYKIWINDVYVGSGGTNETQSLKGKGELEVRTELITVPLDTLPQEVVNIIIQEGYQGTLRIEGTLQVSGSFGTGSVPFHGEGTTGTPIAT